MALEPDQLAALAAVDGARELLAAGCPDTATLEAVAKSQGWGPPDPNDVSPVNTFWPPLAAPMTEFGGTPWGVEVILENERPVISLHFWAWSEGDDEIPGLEEKLRKAALEDSYERILDALRMHLGPPAAEAAEEGESIGDELEDDIVLRRAGWLVAGGRVVLWQGQQYPAYTPKVETIVFLAPGPFDSLLDVPW